MIWVEEKKRKGKKKIKEVAFVFSGLVSPVLFKRDFSLKLYAPNFSERFLLWNVTDP